MTKVVIVGAGRGGRALLEMFMGDHTVSILGVADIHPWAPGLELARRLNIPVSTDFRELITDPAVDLIIDVTGSADVHRTIWRLKPPRAEVMGGLSAKFMWDLVEERKRAEEMEDRYSLIRRELHAQSEGEFIIGQNPKMREIADLLARVAPTPATVLIRGEVGTGKELVARALHRYSHLRDKPLITVNCTTLTPALMDSELFGVRRAPAAVADKGGLFEKADGGTIFLDEVGDLSLAIQGKLLRVLQGGELTPMGDAIPRKVRLRLIAASSRDLEAAVEKGEFREDLFYRFNSFSITLPPLRERAEDIPVLAYHFLKRAEARVNKKVDRLVPEALDVLARYPWPGNLRELENVIERAVVLTSSRQIEPRHLALHVQEEAGRPLLSGGSLLEAKTRVVAEFEREAVVRFLREAGGNVSLAAQRARITRRNFHRLIVKYSINAGNYRKEKRAAH